MSATKVLAKMEELALTVLEVIHANAKMDGQAIIVTKIAGLVLAKMEELAPTVMEIIHANAKMDGQAIFVTKI